MMNRRLTDFSNTPILLFFAIFSMGYFIISVGITTMIFEKLEFIFLNILLLSYISWEIWRSARTGRLRVLMQPAVLASLLHFIGSYFIPNLRYMYSESNFVLYPGLLFSNSDLFEHLNLAMLAILLAVLAMWQGYRTRFALRFALRARLFIKRKRLIRTEFRVNFLAILILGAVSIGAVFIQIKLGVFGYSSDIDSLERTANIRAWLKLAIDGGVLVLLVLSLAVFSERYRRRAGVWVLFLVILTSQLIIGFLSGFKSQVVMPVVIVGVSYYVMSGRIPYKWIGVAVIMVVLSYQVIEPFRYLRNQTNYNSYSLGAIASTVIDAASVEKEANGFFGSTLAERVLARQDMTTYTAQSIAFKDLYGTPENSPDFLGNILLSPAHAFVPRLIWSDKATENTGYWYNLTVLGAHHTSMTSMAMGPVSYAYFAGGYLGIFVVFWIIGIMQRISFETFTRLGLGGWIIYLGLLSPLVMIPSSVGGMFAGFFRVIPFMILAQYWLLSRRR